MNDQKLTLYDVQWQLIRISMLKGNQESGEGGFTTVAGTKANLNKLSAYLGKNPSVDKLWRVLNLLNAVRMGNSGQGRTGDDHDKMIITFREGVQEKYNKAEKKFSPPSEAAVKTSLGTVDTAQLQILKRNLGLRWKNRASDTSRTELAWFMGLLDAELSSRVGRSK